MKKSTVQPHHISHIILFLVVKFHVTITPALADAQTGNSATFKPGNYTWGYGKDISDPVSFTGTNSAFGEGKAFNFVQGGNAIDIMGSTTYGASGRWVGRAIPVYRKPSTKVVATSLYVRGEIGNPNVYFPYGTPQQAPTGTAPSNFNPYNNVYRPYTPYHTPYQGSTPNIPVNYNPYGNRPQVSNFIPSLQGYNPYNNYYQGKYNSFGSPNILYKEVDPRYLLYDNNLGARSYLFSRGSNDINLVPQGTFSQNLGMSSISNEVSSFDSEIELLDLPLNSQKTPRSAKGLFSFFRKNDSKPFQKSATSTPLNEISNEVDTVGSGIISVLPARDKFNTTRDSRYGSKYFSNNRQNGQTQQNDSGSGSRYFLNMSQNDQIKNGSRYGSRYFPNTSQNDQPEISNEVDTVGSGIIRVLPARGKFNTTRDSRYGSNNFSNNRQNGQTQQNDSGYGSRYFLNMSQNDQMKNGSRYGSRYFPNRSQNDQPQNGSRYGSRYFPNIRQNGQTENDIDVGSGWTLIKPRYVATITQVYSPSLERTSTETSRIVFPTREQFLSTTQAPFSIKSTKDKALSPKVSDRNKKKNSSMNNSTLHELAQQESNDEVEKVETNSGVMMSISVLTMASAMTTCVLMTQWLSKLSQVVITHTTMSQ